MMISEYGIDKGKRDYKLYGLVLCKRKNGKILTVYKIVISKFNFQ